MNGSHSHMPDTTSRISISPYRRSIRRLVASALLFTSSLLLVASMGFAQEGSSCGDFAAPEDAQIALEENPDLDSDGNGVACDEDPDLFTQGNEATPRDEFAQVMEESTTDTEGTTDTEDADEAAEEDSQSAGSSQTPATGGVALVPLAGSTLTALLGGSMLLRRRA